MGLNAQSVKGEGAGGDVPPTDWDLAGVCAIDNDSDGERVFAGIDDCRGVGPVEGAWEVGVGVRRRQLARVAAGPESGVAPNVVTPSSVAETAL